MYTDIVFRTHPFGKEKKTVFHLHRYKVISFIHSCRGKTKVGIIYI